MKKELAKLVKSIVRKSHFGKVSFELGKKSVITDGVRLVLLSEDYGYAHEECKLDLKGVIEKSIGGNRVKVAINMEELEKVYAEQKGIHIKNKINTYEITKGKKYNFNTIFLLEILKGFQTNIVWVNKEDKFAPMYVVSSEGDLALLPPVMVK